MFVKYEARSLKYLPKQPVNYLQVGSKMLLGALDVGTCIFFCDGRCVSLPCDPCVLG